MKRRIHKIGLLLLAGFGILGIATSCSTADYKPSGHDHHKMKTGGAP